MPLICYNSHDNDSKERLENALRTEVPSETIEIYQSIEGLSKRLCKSHQGQDVAVIIIADMAEYLRILSIKRLLNDLRIILVLPGRSEEIVSAGHKLHPRFISYSDSDFGDVAIVVKRMIKLASQNTNIMKIGRSVLN